VKKKTMKLRMLGNLEQKLMRMKKLAQMVQMKLVQVALAYLLVSHLMRIPQVQLREGKTSFHFGCKIMKLVRD
jgi:hypothetical protein